MSWQTKLVGDEDERAVSPVIGVILMVAITVILAAVIAAFVLDLGQSQSASVSAGVDIENNSDIVSVQLTDKGNADYVVLRGLENGSESASGEAAGCDDEIDSECILEDTGSTATFDGTNDDDVAVVAVSEDGDETTIATAE